VEAARIGRAATTRLSIALPPGAELTSYPAITRDGRTVAYVAQQGSGDTRLYLRDINAFETRTVPGSSGAKQPFFSPNGEWVAFFAQGQLLKAEVGGGTPIRLVEAAYAFGGTWNDDDTIIYAASLGSGLLQIAAGGGSPTSLTKPDGAALGYAHVFPQALPGGRSILFTTWGQANGAAVLSLASRQWEVVLPQPGSAVATFSSSGGSTGHVLLVDLAAGIRAAPFDAARPGPTSAEALVLSDVYYEVEVESLGWLAVSHTGTAVYAAGDPARMTLVWVNRDGTSEPLAGGQGGQDVYREAQLSPDGRRAVIRRGNDMWAYDLERGTTTRLTTGTSNLLPVWSHDGTRVLFSSNQGGDWDIHAQPPDGSSPAAALFRRPYDQFPLSTLADGTLVFLDIQPTTGRDLWILSPGGEASPLRVTPFNETQAQVSPGPAGGPRRVAYASDESGRFEIYVEPYPVGGNRTTVSTGGGILPRWSGDGSELFYVADDAVVAVAVRPDGSFGPPRRLFDRSPFLFNHRFNSYSVAPDGQRFLMIRRDPGSVPRQLNVILNWSAAGRLSPPPHHDSRGSRFSPFCRAR
jgi:Tol biopolymer transport system component